MSGSARPQYRDRLRLQFHRWDGAGHQHPAIGPILRIARRTRTAHFSRRPAGVVKIGPFPAPRVELRIHRIAWPSHIIEPGHLALARRRSISCVPDAFPLLASIYHALGVAVSLHQKAGLIGDLGFGRELCEIPDDRRQQVFAGPQMRADIHRFIAPVMQIAARRAQTD